jgi:hypothetical protein
MVNFALFCERNVADFSKNVHVVNMLNRGDFQRKIWCLVHTAP